jgi:hypothetical protein
MITMDSKEKFVLRITDAFTKHAVVTEIVNKDANLKGVLQQVQHSSPNPHQWQKRIIQQVIGRALLAPLCQPHEDLSSPSAVQCAG